MSHQDHIDECFLIHLTDWVGSDVTVEEEAMAFQARDEQGFSIREAAALILSEREAVAA